ncbi:hypothetical protein Fmac_006848 [Flemingia macrophylla]|uniref:Tr-type G domain-containing protein n=1 Tax=Flemingia macrophylla TaxID=520843 RepID=A0ABD1NC95_9FABA
MLMNGVARAWKEGSKFASIFAAHSVYASARCVPDFINPSSHGVPAFGRETKECGIRCFHASLQVWAKNDGPLDLKTPKKVKYSRRDHRRQPTVRNVTATKSNPDKTVEIFEGMTLVELAKRSGKSVSSLQDVLTNVGEKVESEFEPLSMDIAELAAMEAGVNVKRLHSVQGTEILPRPAVVTVMGHVDHGKTSLLDALRQTSVAAREAGGITQHLGAFVVVMPSGASITFLDTPGHAAFSAMRARGAAVTDIVVLVVAADDGVMPQTLEAIAHAKAANVPIVVAINKCDKPGANPEKVKLQLASEGMLLEEMGGDIQVVEVSATEKIGLDNLEEALLLQADMMDLKARIDGPAQAYVVEARLDKGRGPLITTIVKAGTLVCGQHVVVGSQWGRIRAIKDTAGKLTQRATPAMPVEIEGLRGLPMAGDDVIVVHSEERARMLSSGRQRKYEENRLKNKMIQDKQTTSDDSAEVPQRVEMPVFINVVHVGVGPISQSDVDLAQACGACIVGFNVKTPPTPLSQAATRASIKIILHRVIYHLLEDIGNLIIEKAPGTSETHVAGQAEVMSIFEIKGSKSKGPDVKIAGCRVIDGSVTRSATMRLLRSGEVVFEGLCTSLKREKQDVDTVKKGNECGLVINDWHDFQVGDVIQCLQQVVRKPKFIKSESGAVRIEC